MSIRPKHLEFCMYYLQTNDPGVAYKMAYPKAGIKSLYAAASRLMARPDVSAWIEETRHRMQERLLTQIEDTQVQAKKEQLLSIAEKRNVLTGIILGETKRTRHIKTKYGVTKVEDDQPVYALLRAIDLDTRLENFQNYLLHRDSWGKNQAPSPQVERAGVRFHINTPTLQQQVNILIAQTTKAETKVEPGSFTSLSPGEGRGEASLAPATTSLSPGEGRGEAFFSNPVYLTLLNKTAPVTAPVPLNLPPKQSPNHLPRLGRGSG